MGQRLTSTYLFFLSHNFSFGLQKAVGIFLPVILLLLFSLYYPLALNAKILLTVGYGSLTMGIADQIGPYKHKRNELLASLVGITLVAFLFSHHHELSFLMIINLSLIAFISGFISNFGGKFYLIGFVMAFSAIMGSRGELPPANYTFYYGYGAFIYLLYTLFISKFFEHYIIRHNLSNIFFLLARHLKNLSSCYRQNSDIEKEYKKVINSQSDLLKELQLLRDFLFRLKDPNHEKVKKMIYELLFLIDIRELSLLPYQEFSRIRDIFPNTDIQIFFRDTFFKAGNNLEEMGLYTLHAAEKLRRLGFKAELRALEYELLLLKEAVTKNDESHSKEPPEEEALKEGYQILISHYRKAWSLSRKLERLRLLLIGHYTPDETLNQQSFSRFLSHSYWTRNYLKDSMHLSSNVMRFSIRLSLAMFSALLLVKLVSSTDTLAHGFWIAFALLSLMRPEYGRTKTRSRERVVGTFLGCILGGVLLTLNLNPVVLTIILFLAVVLNRGLSSINNQLSIVFITLYVLILFNLDKDLSELNGLAIALERILDTIVAAIIAIVFNRLLPYWEKFTIKEQDEKIERVLVEVFNSLKPIASHNQEGILHLRHSLREAQSAIVNFSNSLTRMQNEPRKSQVQNISDLTDQLVVYQSLLAELSYLGFLMENSTVTPQSIPEFTTSFTTVEERFCPLHPQQPTQTKEDAPPFEARELKPLIWLLEDYQPKEA